MKLAAVDIGSNAIRFQISTVLDANDRTVFKKLEYVRFPLRLGHDVFTTSRISDKSEEKFVKLMRAYKLLIELYEADDYMFCATSAMRDAVNSKQILDRVKKETGIEIKVISGDEEANYIYESHVAENLGSNESYLYIDVGGAFLKSPSKDLLTPILAKKAFNFFSSCLSSLVET